MIRALSFISFLIVTTFFFISEAKAQVYSDGYVDRIDNYTYRSGYWYFGSDYSIPYTRVRYQNPGYWYNGCYVNGSFYYTYTRYYAPTPPPIAATITAKDSDWRTQLLKVAEQRDKYNGQIQKQALEHAQYMEAVKALGLSPPIPGTYVTGGYGGYGSGIGIPSGYSISGNYYNYPLYGVNANTQYGYSYNQIAKLYGDTDINQLFQMSAQLTASAQKLAGDANSQFSGIVSQEGNNKARVAELLAKGAIMAQMLQALQAPPPAKVEGLSFRIEPGGKVTKDDAKVTASDKEKLRDMLGSLLAEKCSSCHYGKTIKSNFDIATYFEMSLEEKQKRVFPRIFTNDTKLMMPRNADGGPGTPLTDSERQLFLMN